MVCWRRVTLLCFFVGVSSSPDAVSEGGLICADGTRPRCSNGGTLQPPQTHCDEGRPACADGSEPMWPASVPRANPPTSSSPHAAPLLGAVGRTTVSGMDTRTGTKFAVGEQIHGPLEFGFGPQQNETLEDFGCDEASLGYVVGGIDIQTAEQMVAFQCGIMLPRLQHEGAGGYISLLDECGWHAQGSHFHEQLSCLYDAFAGGHSSQVGAASDGKAIYGMWEDKTTNKLPLLDACGGHFGSTPASVEKLYHYHVQDGPPFTVGCFGPNDMGTLVTVEQCRSFYPGCDGNLITVTTPRGSYLYDDWCPCFDGNASNSGVDIVPLKAFEEEEEEDTRIPMAPPTAAPTASPTEVTAAIHREHPPASPTGPPTPSPSLVEADVSFRALSEDGARDLAQAPTAQMPTPATPTMLPPTPEPPTPLPPTPEPPTNAPTQAPTPAPTTAAPTVAPTEMPTTAPTTAGPTPEPTTAAPTPPTPAPTPEPTHEPTFEHEALIVQESLVAPRLAVRGQVQISLGGSATLTDLQTDRVALAALANAIAASMHSVTAAMVRIVSVTFAARRMGIAERRLAGAVQVVFEVLVPVDTGAVTNAQSAAASMRGSDLAFNIASSFQSAGLSSLYQVDVLTVDTQASGGCAPWPCGDVSTSYAVSGVGDGLGDAKHITCAPGYESSSGSEAVLICDGRTPWSLDGVDLQCVQADPFLPELVRSLRVPGGPSIALPSRSRTDAPALMLIAPASVANSANQIYHAVALKELVGESADSDSFQLWPSGLPELLQEVEEHRVQYAERVPASVAPATAMGPLTLLVGGVGPLKLGEVSGTVHVVEGPLSGGGGWLLHTLAEKRKGWFYRQASLDVDVDGDGLHDLLATRVEWPTDPTGTRGQLVCLRQPPVAGRSSTFRAPWLELHVIAEGPAGPFASARLDGSKLPVIALAEDHKFTDKAFSSGFGQEQALALYSCDATSWSHCVIKGTTQRVLLGTNLGTISGIAFVDVNSDGLEDLLVTSDRSDGQVGLFVFEQPRTAGPRAYAKVAWKRQPWQRHSLVYWTIPPHGVRPTGGQGGGAPKIRAGGSVGLGFSVCQEGVPEGLNTEVCRDFRPKHLYEKSVPFSHNPMPSSAIAFRRHTGSLKGKPDIAFSAGDGGTVWLLRPRHPTTSTDWGYWREALVETASGVGQLAAFDADGDGHTELFVPRLGDDLLEIYTYGPITFDNRCGLCWDCLNKNGRCPCCCVHTEACQKCSGVQQGCNAELPTGMPNASDCFDCGLCRDKDFLRREGCVCR